MLVRDLRREPELGVIWSWRTEDDRPAAYRHDNKGPEVVVGVKGGKTNDLWHHTGPQWGAEPRLIVHRGGLYPAGEWIKGDWKAYDEDEDRMRAFAESIELPVDGLP